MLCSKLLCPWESLCLRISGFSWTEREPSLAGMLMLHACLLGCSQPRLSVTLPTSPGKEPHSQYNGDREVLVPSALFHLATVQWVTILKLLRGILEGICVLGNEIQNLCPGFAF